MRKLLLMLVLLSSPLWAQEAALDAELGPNLARNQVFYNGNPGGVVNQGRSPTFTLPRSTRIDFIMNYHYNGGRGAPPGTIALRAADGRLFGPWQAVGAHGGKYWLVQPGSTLPAGAYTVLDSDPATWSCNAESGMLGHTLIKGLADARQLVRRGWALCARKRFQEAESVLLQAVAAAPASGAAWSNLGWAQAGLGKNQEALASLQRALELDPLDALAWSNQGFVLMNLRQTFKAVQAFDRACQLDPNDYGARKYLLKVTPTR